MADAGLRHRTQRGPGPACRARGPARPRARRDGADPLRPGDPPGRSDAVRGRPAALGPGPSARHRARQRHRPDRRRLPGTADDQHVEPGPGGLHDFAGRPDRATGRVADRARDVAGSGYFRGKRARPGWFRPHRRALNTIQGAGHMSDNQDAAAPAKSKHELKAQLRPALPALALILGLIAAWMAWSGFEQYRADSRRADLTRMRDAIVAQVGASVNK